MSEVRRYIGIVAVRMLRISESDDVQVEATARVVTKTLHTTGKRGYDATFQIFTSGRSAKINSLDDTKAGREIRDTKFKQRLRRLGMVLLANDFTKEEVVDAINAANLFHTPINPDDPSTSIVAIQ